MFVQSAEVHKFSSLFGDANKLHYPGPSRRNDIKWLSILIAELDPFKVCTLLCIRVLFFGCTCLF